MAIDLPVIPSFQAKKKKKHKVNQNVSKWTLFSVCLIIVLIVVAITKTIIPLLLIGLVLAFIWSQATKPVAHFEKEINSNDKQLNLFYQNHASTGISRDIKQSKKENRAA